MSTRPTDVEVGTACQQLYNLACNDPDGYRLLAHLVSLYAWLLDQTAESEQASAYGRGVSEVHVLAQVGGDLEGRLRDPLLREQRRLKRNWRADLRNAGHRWSDDASQVTASADAQAG
jgi:hypothetical protein